MQDTVTREEPSNILARLSFEGEAPTSGDFKFAMARQMQGVLWKRRDVFKKQWRPRWFVLHAEQHILTYYLVNENAVTGSTSSITNGRSGSSTSLNRSRASSTDQSTVSQHSTDYDVVPRGTIYLVGSTVEANDVLSSEEQQLYVITITNHETATHAHLAARSQADRLEWLSHMEQACSVSNSGASPFASRHYQRSMNTPEGLTTTGNSPAAQSAFQDEGWKTLPSSSLTENIPPSITDKAEQLLKDHLPLVNKSHPSWKFQHDKDGIHCCCTNDNSMVRAIRKTAHHPVEYLELMWDLDRVLEFETSVSHQERLKLLNPFTFLVHSAYHRVWPTASRDFSVAGQWRLLENEAGERAVVLLAFSHPIAEELRPETSAHVRGVLHISLNMWKFCSDGSTTHTRIVSYDLKGNIPKAIMQTVLTQQASMPRVVDLYLQNAKASEAGGADRTFVMEYKVVTGLLQAVLENRAARNATSKGESSEDTETLVTSERRAAEEEIVNPTAPVLWKEALALGGPVFLYHCIRWFFTDLVAVGLFLVAAFAGVNWSIQQRKPREE